MILIFCLIKNKNNYSSTAFVLFSFMDRTIMMNSQSSGYSSDSQDDLSCASYSSGWERSSTTDYFDSSDTELELELENTKEPFYEDGTKIFDLDYECKLVVLPNPYKKQTIVDLIVEEDKQDQEADKTDFITTTNPWKKVEGSFAKDPWEFLEKPATPPAPTLKFLPKTTERSHHPHHNHHQKIDNSNTNKLCKYKTECRMNRNNNCNMVHSLADWKPKICRFNNGCRRKKSCSYYHTETPIAEYLRLMISTDSTIYAKNSALYEKYLK